MRPRWLSAKVARGSAAAAGLMVFGGVLMSACSNGGASLAQQACVHVDASIKLYTRAEHDTNQATAARNAERAIADLEAAEPLAARANSADPAYNPLMTTLQEIGRTSESNLIPALKAQCEAAMNPTSQSPVGGGSTPVTSPG